MKKQNRSEKQDVPLTKEEKKIRRRGILLVIISYILSFVLMLLGVIMQPNMPEFFIRSAKWILILCYVLLIIAFLLNVVLKKRYIKNLENQKVEELQRYLISHRDSAEKTSVQKLAFIKRWKMLTGLYAVLFFICAVGSAFCIGVVYDEDFSIPFSMVSGFMFLCAISRIHFPVKEEILDEAKIYVSAKEYPELYAMARQASDMLQCNGNIKIAVLADCSGSIAKVGNTYSVQIGAILLDILSKEELYHVFLHEFSHVAGNHNISEKEDRYNSWLCNGGNPNVLSGLISMFFIYFDVVYNFEYNLYLYSASILRETEADQAMAEFGDHSIAASALLKLKYYDLYMWEGGTYDEPSLFENEKLQKDFLHNQINSFQKAIGKRSDVWNRLTEAEILSRSATHPTTRMRLKALGVTDFHVMDSVKSDTYLKECENALAHVEELIYQQRIETYAEERKMLYLAPKKKVEEWEKEGKPLKSEEYADIYYALHQLGRYSDSEVLCDRVIAELPSSANSYAYFMKGCFLLHRYDPTGIDYVYQAIEQNTNYIEEGLDIIGEFCCLTGRQEELDAYREKAVILAQKEKDLYSQITILSKKDTLTCEHLPDNMLNSILAFIRTIDENAIKNIYLVRKTISEDFFTSAFIIRFRDETEQEVQNRILNKIFWHLDTCSSWQFSLFNYSEVKGVRVENIEGSCVFSKNENE